MALNAPIQGSAADIIKVAMLNVDRALARGRRWRSRMLLQVHDELVFEVAAGEREALEALVREQMACSRRPDRPPRRLRRHRAQLARRRALSVGPVRRQAAEAVPPQPWVRSRLTRQQRRRTATVDARARAVSSSVDGVDQLSRPARPATSAAQTQVDRPRAWRASTL